MAINSVDVVSGFQSVVVRFVVDFVVVGLVVGLVVLVVGWVVVLVDVVEDDFVVEGGPLLNLKVKVRENFLKISDRAYLQSGVKLMSSTAMSESPATPTVASIIT